MLQRGNSVPLCRDESPSMPFPRVPGTPQWLDLCQLHVVFIMNQTPALSKQLRETLSSGLCPIKYLFFSLDVLYRCPGLLTQILRTGTWCPFFFGPCQCWHLGKLFGFVKELGGLFIWAVILPTWSTQKREKEIPSSAFTPSAVTFLSADLTPGSHFSSCRCGGSVRKEGREEGKKKNRKEGKRKRR